MSCFRRDADYCTLRVDFENKYIREYVLIDMFKRSNYYNLAINEAVLLLNTL